MLKTSWLMFGAYLTIFVFLSAVLIYHWRQYGMKNKKIILAEFVYLAGAVALAFGTFFALFSVS